MEERSEGEVVSIRNAQKVRPIAEEFLQELERCGAETLRLVQEGGLDLVEPPRMVEATLVDDAEISRVHGEFMDDPTPTDVITFPYGASGEILISVETAQRQAMVFGTVFEREVALYLVHGILHLCGYEDGSREGRALMGQLQEELLEASFEVG